MTDTWEQWVFDCPLHGIERAVYCFRASDPALADRWFKVRVTEEVLETTRRERLEHWRAWCDQWTRAEEQDRRLLNEQRRP